jgi:hypothetical protein
MANENIPDTFDTMQRAFTSMWPQVGKSTAQTAQVFWKNQEKILESMHELAQGWFERRREATRTALDAAQNIATCKSPADVIQECHSWMMRSAERVAADGVACQRHAMNVAEAVAAQLPAEAEHIKNGVMSAVRASEKAVSRAEAA